MLENVIEGVIDAMPNQPEHQAARDRLLADRSAKLVRIRQAASKVIDIGNEIDRPGLPSELVRAIGDLAYVYLADTDKDLATIEHLAALDRLQPGDDEPGSGIDGLMNPSKKPGQ